MKLKTITIHGFKSFADRVVIHYHDGITGVIGPNGSGKSNIIDAVRWVMGEQTAKSLRAEESSDIIFAGSQNRKPLSMAEVTLMFVNDGENCPPEYMHMPEISIGRRIYRSGEREYFMNKQSCRLKDIVEFLLSVGLGSKSYSIIQQEKRDRIISAKPEDLRDILEEAAGISIFKQRRNEAEKRLDNTNTQLLNLTQVDTELEKQIINLKDQVEKASKKMELVTELREKSVTLIHNHVGAFRAVRNKLLAEINEQSKVVETNVVETAGLDARANDLKTSQLDAMASIKTLEDAYYDKKSALVKFTERLENERRHAEERNTQRATLQSELSEERSTLTRDEELLTKYIAELETGETELRAIDDVLLGFEERIEELDEGLLVERVRSEEMRSEIRAIEELLSQLRHKNQSLLEIIEKSNQVVRRNEELLASARDVKGNLNKEADALRAQIFELSKGSEEFILERTRIEKELHELNVNLDERREKRDEYKHKAIELNSHVASLEKIISSNQGLSDGAIVLRESLKDRIEGFLFERVGVHKDDEGILERALPYLLESALVQDSESLIDILDKAEEMNLSRVGFIVRDMLVPFSAEEEESKNSILKISGIRSLGDRLVTCEDPALKHLMNRIFIARDEWLLFKAHREFAQKHQFILISERGTVVTPSHEIAFGEAAQGEGQGLLQRKRELSEITTERDSFQGELATQEGLVFELSERRNGLLARAKELDEKLSHEKYETLKLTNQLEQIELNLRHAEENFSRLTREFETVSSDIEESKRNFSVNQSQMDEHETEKNRFQVELTEFDSELADKIETRDELRTQRESKRTDRIRIAERQNHQRTRYEEIKLNLDRTRSKVDRLIFQLSEITNNIQNSTDNDASLVNEIKVLQSELSIKERELNEALTAEAEISEELRVIENKLKSARETQESKQRIINDRKQELAKCEVILETAENDAWERFQLKPEDLPNEAPDEPGLRSKLESQIKKLQNEITELGSVNELAVEEYRSVEERRAFLLSQKEDCDRSIENLRQMITEIEETTKVRFKEIYERVNIEFAKLFPVLFPGGEAQLSMLQPEDLLNTGVEILCRLPGKKQQNMSLFSGGEKALTAISLIFALLKTRPAPFCFLDEVDAPLDEANVGRFNNVLEALSDEFQFVVITHNRRTMEVLDTIYGISMSEPGVSKLVSVDLSEVPGHLKKKSAISAPKERIGASAAP